MYEEGMYVRTNLGVIAKLKRVFNFKHKDYFLNYSDSAVNCKSSDVVGNKGLIIKASYNPIDLIEVGDIVTFKEDNDVYKVSAIPNESCEEFWLYFEHEGAKALGIEDIEVSKEVMKSELESILTKEQFENMSYKIGE